MARRGGEAGPSPQGPERSSGHPLARVAVVAPLEDVLTYQVPESLRSAVRPGARVRVPLGRRMCTGFVVGLTHETPALPSGKLRSVVAVADGEPVLGDEMRDLCRWAADYYFASWGEVLSCAVPPPAVPRRPRILHLTETGRLDPAAAAAACGRSARRRELVRLLAGAPEGIAAEDLPTGERRVVAPLLAAEIVAWRDATVTPAATAPLAAPPPRRRTLNAPQQAACDALREAVGAGRFAPFLLRGVTGSGKTEVYLHAADEALRRGRGTLVLVPEIGLTPLLGRRFRAWFGSRVAILHSGMARADRQGEWRRVRAGEAAVVLGTRSAVFAPVERLGLVVVDEEQDGSYKQAERPRYHARDLALVRARGAEAVVVLGSATPSMESFRNAERGRYRLLTLPERVEGRALAEAELVDMREEFRRSGSRVLLSERLHDLLRVRLERREQSILLLNRRGYASFLLCRECGGIEQCSRCAVSLVLHRREGRLRCHYCGQVRKLRERCGACNGSRLHPGGEGTERLEEEIRQRLPQARLARLDRDTAGRRGEAERVLERFRGGEVDLLLGTQMVAKGHDFPRVTLVGVLAADGILGLPDFRAAERTFQMLTQVAGRSGRGEAGGQVVIQTFQPDHYAIRHARSQDFDGFYAEEIRFRRLLQYPPETVLINLVVTRRDLAAAVRQAAVLAKAVTEAGEGFVQVLGPAPAPLARLHGLHRMQVLAKARSRARLAAAVRRALEETRTGGWDRRHLVVDVDPVSVL